MTKEQPKLSEKELALFEKFLNIVRGKVDMKYRLRLLLDPDNLETTTRLTSSQVDYVSISHFVSEHFREFKALKDAAKQFCLTNISLDGLGREEAIRYEGAIGESKLLKNISLFKTDETKAVKGKT